MNPTTVSPNCVVVVKHYESFAPWPYFCPAGKRTVGYGHVIIPGDAITYPMTDASASELLMKDLNKFIPQVLALLKVVVTQAQFDALVSMAFNTGVGKADGIEGDFADSTLMKYVNKGQWQLAAGEFGKWIFGGGKILNGLVFRRKTEANLFSTGKVVFYN